jgi:hypothetical protein
MKAFSKASLVLATVTSLAVIGGGVAFAGSWFTTAPTLRVKKLTTATMPEFDSGPAVDLRNGTVTVQWVAQKLVKGVTVQRYIVRRYNVTTGASSQICGDAVTVSKCRDSDVPRGKWEYTVRTAHYQWRGPESPHSDAITIAPAKSTAKLAVPTMEAAPATTPAPTPTADEKLVTPEPSKTTDPTTNATTEAPTESATPGPSGSSTINPVA